MSLFGFGKPNIKKMKASHDVEGLIKALHNKNFNVRISTLEALGDMGDARAVDVIIPFLKEVKYH